MAFGLILGTVFSALFRFFAFVFLRWIPFRHGVYLVPVLFVLSSLFIVMRAFAPRRRAASINVTQREDLVEGEGAAFKQSTTAVEVSTPSKKKKRMRRRRAALTVTDSGAYASSNGGDMVGYEDEDEEEIEIRKSVGVLGLLGVALFGAPTRSRTLALVTVLLHALALGGVLDLALSPALSMHVRDLAFARIGAVYPTSAKLLARVPPLPTANGTIAALPESGCYDAARVQYRTSSPLGPWTTGPSLRACSGHDYVAHADLNGLLAATKYEYRLVGAADSLIDSRFSAEASRGAGAPLSFTTAPDPALETIAGAHFTFASASCLKPNFPYDGPLARWAIKGARQLASWIDKSHVDFVLFMGDFMYADVPVWRGPALAWYHKLYRQIYASPDWRAVTERVPTLHIYDDHEIINDYSAESDEQVFQIANAAYLDYNGLANPRARSIEGDVPESADLVDDELGNWYTYNYGAHASFFVLDTRAARSSNYAPDDEFKTMLGARQKQALFDWLDAVNETVTFKFVVSSVPLMSLWTYGEDTWAGFITERSQVLDKLQYVPNVIVLSGDRHEFAAASLRKTITEFSTSPFNQFYLPVRTLSQNNAVPGDDLLLKYIPDGNHKFTLFTVDTRVPLDPRVYVQLVVDDEVAWNVTYHGKPVRRLAGTPASRAGGGGSTARKALGALRHTLAELLAFTRFKWF